MDRMVQRRRATQERRPEAPAQRAARGRPTAGNHALARAALQRRVVSFDTVMDRITPPATDLVEELRRRRRYVTAPGSTVEDEVQRRLHNPLKRARDVPSYVTAVLEPGVRKSVVRTGKSANVGQMGQDEFYIVRGIHETFEGGHLIPHALFDAGDAVASSAGDYPNLVPMSRNTNVVSWARKEERIRQELGRLRPNQQLKVEVPIAYTDYEVTLRDIGTRFGLTIDPRHEEDRVELHGWIPDRIGPAKLTDVRRQTHVLTSPAKENRLRARRQDPVGTGREAVEAFDDLGVALTRRFRPRLEQLA